MVTHDNTRLWYVIFQVEEVFAESYDDKEAEKETSEVRNEEEENAVKVCRLALK